MNHPSRDACWPSDLEKTFHITLKFHATAEKQEISPIPDRTEIMMECICGVSILAGGVHAHLAAAIVPIAQLSQP